MRFGILGPLRVGDGAGDRAVTANRDRVVLAMLLLRANHVVPVDDLIDAMWADGPPATARGQLQSCVSRLRRLLTAAGGSADAVVSDPAGYAVLVGAGDLDADVFADLVRRARAAAGADRLDEALELFRAALDLWRGPALPGIASPAVRQGATVLDEQHVAAIEDRLDVELALGRHREILAELTGLVERHRLRERLRGQLMTAYHRSGRQAEALAEYRRIRDTLRDELGIEPAAALRDLHRRLLTGEDCAAVRPAAPAAPVRCLPRAVADFTGRADAVRRLLRAAHAADPSAPVVQVIDGMAGSGKTTLAVHVANLLTASHPDAQLFVDLHGHSDRAPVEPTGALATLLRQLGVPGERLPTEFEDRISLWRTEASTRRMVVVLDNAASTAQVLPLLPASPGCVALVTSRRRLVGLDGVRPESLRVLSRAEAVELLARVAGERVLAEPGSAADVVRRCGYLPLAIRLAGARLAHRPRWRVADLVRRLGEPGAVLPELSVEDRTVAGAFALSYDQLPEPARVLFRALGLFPGDHFDAPAAAALAGLPVDEAEHLLDGLVDQHLIEETDDRRFRFHDLIREYAHELGHRLGPQARRSARTALLDYYLHAAATLSLPLEGAPRRDLFNPGTPLRPDLLPAGDTDSQGWLRRELANLDAVSRCAQECAEDRYGWMIPRAAWRMLYQHSHFDDVVTLQVRALAAAHRLGDDTAIANASNYLASGYYRTGRSEEAVQALQVALDRWTRLGKVSGVAAAHLNLAMLHSDAGRFTLALEHGNASLAIRRRTQHLAGIAHAAAVLGEIVERTGQLRAALRWQRRSLSLAREVGSALQVATALGNLARVRGLLGDHAAAMRGLRVALAIKRRVHTPHAESEVLHDMAVLQRAAGRLDDALALHRAALRTSQDIGDHRLISRINNELAVTMRVTGDRVTALDLHRQALASATTANQVYEQARALFGLADCLPADDPAVRGHRQRAEALYRRMGLCVSGAGMPSLAEVAQR